MGFVPVSRSKTEGDEAAVLVCLFKQHCVQCVAGLYTQTRVRADLGVNILRDQQP